MRSTLLYSALLTALFTINISFARESEPIRFEQMPALESLPNKEVLDILQDSDGYIWIATAGGLYQYDGYTTKEYRSNIYTPNLFDDNHTKSLCEDGDNRLYIGTLAGLSILDKRSGVITNSRDERLVNNDVDAILPIGDGDVWLGTERGVLRYDPHTDCCTKIGGKINELRTIKSLIRDSKGDIWIGTWDQGVHRYSIETNQVYSYPRLNSQNSAHVIFEDSKGRIWVGSFGYGLVLLHNPHDNKTPKYEKFTANKKKPRHISDGYIYRIAESIETNTIWVGTRRGITIIPTDSALDSRWRNIGIGESAYSLYGGGVDAITADRQGNIWIGSVGGGVCCVLTKNQFINRFTPADKMTNPQSEIIRSIAVGSNGDIHIGIGSIGVGVTRNSQSQGELKPYPYIDSETGDSKFLRVNSIVESPTTPRMWYGTNMGLIYADSDDTPKYEHMLLYKVYISEIIHDTTKGYWVASKGGIHHIDEATLQTSAIVTGKYEYTSLLYQERDNVLWAGSLNNGICRINLKDESTRVLESKIYSAENNLIPSSHINDIFMDDDNRLWVATNGGGLCYYDQTQDCFHSLNNDIYFPTDNVTSIIDDEQGRLWMGSNVGLISLVKSDDFAQYKLQLYDKSNGLPDNILFPRSVAKAKSGELYFGTGRGYIHFNPNRVVNLSVDSKVFITDIKLNNRSISQLDSLERVKITPYTPGYSERIDITPQYSNFTIEFSPMSYHNPNSIIYAYMLEGYDSEWQYSNFERRFAHYANVPYGNYTFRLKSTCSDGQWQDYLRSIRVNIIPPLYRSWWAYTIYTLLLLVILLIIFHLVRQRIRLRTTIKVQALDRERLEAINHEKLRFFTNITHELFTPITIVAAAMEGLNQQIPPRKYEVMISNINRLARLIQQILEFRKAETGNLKLSVSRENIPSFVEKNIECFIPLMKKKNIEIRWICNTIEDLQGYMDCDKIDKILYNLLSNALKYNKSGAVVEVSLDYSVAKQIATFTVNDNGEGLSERAMKSLFKRFYDGDFRRYNTIGTGIGLSLVYDLVKLHRGEINVDNRAGEGVAFIVTIPINKSCYASEEIAEEIVGDTFEMATTSGNTTQQESLCVDDMSVEPTTPQQRILIVEDNEDLLSLIVDMLSKRFIVSTATNGKEAIEVLEREDVELIISDVMMPVMDGYELCREVKSNNNFNHIPLLLLTAKCSERDTVDGYNAGADSYITKPFSANILLSRINNLLSKRANQIAKFNEQSVFDVKDMDYSSYDEEFLEKVINIIHENIANPDLDQNMISECTRLSKSSLHRKLKSITGLTASMLIKEIRLKVSFNLFIRRGRNSRISDIAYMVGFNDPKYFSICFKRRFGYLPGNIPEDVTTPPPSVEGYDVDSE